MAYTVPITYIKPITHDVKCFRFLKPRDYTFVPGQATDVALNLSGLTKELRPFTFTGTPEKPYLEFTIKRYEDHHGITNHIHRLNIGDEFLIDEPWGAIEYKGPGYFIAGGAGITPFISIFRSLHQAGNLDGNLLFFSNKTSEDIIYKEELSELLGKNFVNTLTHEKNADYEQGRMDRSFLDRHGVDYSKHFYLCGPDGMVESLNKVLLDAGARADTVVFEK